MEPVVLAAGEDDERVGPLGQRVLLGQEEEVGGRRGEQDDPGDERERPQCAIARSTASSSSGERATEGRPRSSSFM